MGQSLGPEFAQCAGKRSEPAPGPGARKLVEESLERCSRTGVLDRCDLKTRWSASLKDFIHLLKPAVTHTISVSSGGSVELDPPGKPTGLHTTEHKVELPDLGHGSFIYSKAGTQEYVMALGSEETNLRRSLRKFDSQEALVAKVYELLRAGAESVEITLGQEMLTCEYDMTSIMSELEKKGISASASKHAWIVSSYTWMVLVSYKFVPVPDPLKKYVQRLSEKKQTKDMLLRELQHRGTFSREDIERFKKFATDDDFITAAEQYMHIMVDQTNDRRFTLDWLEDPTEEDPDGQPRPPQQPTMAMTKPKTVEACISYMVDGLHAESLNMDNWQFMIGWEPVQVREVQEAMHEAQRFAASGNQMSFMRFALKAATLAGDAVGTSPRGIPKGIRPGLSDEQKDQIIAAGKSMIDDMIERFERSELPRDRFEEQFSELCDTMVHTVETNVLPYGSGPEHHAMCHRQMADYRRYVYVYVPKRRTNDKLISETYMKAQDYARQLPPRCLAGVSSFVNHAVFLAEVYRDSSRAAETCRKHIDYGLKYKAPALDHKIEHQLHNPSEVFNWALLQHNLVAFETRFVLLKVTFRLESWKAYRDLVVKCGDFDTGPAHRRASQEHRRASQEPEGSKTPEATDEDGWPPFVKQSTAENWKSLRGATTEKARHCFETLQGAVSHDAWGHPGARDSARSDTARSSARSANSSSLASSPNTSARRQPGVVHVEEQLPISQETYADLATVKRWLASRPLMSRQDDGDSEEEGVRDKPALRQVRWIDRAEVLDPALEVDPQVLKEMGGGGGLTRKKELWQAEVRKVQALGALRRLSLSVPASRSFLVACVVRLSAPALGATSRGKDRHVWLEELAQELRAWPGTEEVEPKSVEVHLPYELKSIVDNLDDHGACRDQLSVGTARALTLNPGDVLIAPEGKEDAKHLRQYMQDLPKESLPLTLKFQPCLQVKEAKCMEEAPYTDHHLRFEGFRGAQNLQTSSQFPSLETMIKELRATRQSSKNNQSARLPPRRIRDLSARRSPIQSATRGCK